MTSRNVDDGAGHGTASTPGAKHRDTAIPPPLQSDFDRLKEERDEAVEDAHAYAAAAKSQREWKEAAEARATQAEAREKFALELAWQASEKTEAVEAALSEVVGVVEEFVGREEYLLEVNDLPSPPATAEMIRAACKAQSAAFVKVKALLQKLKAGVSPYAGEREGGFRQTINDPQCGTALPDGKVCGQGGEP